MPSIGKAIWKLHYLKPTGSPHGLCGAVQLLIGVYLMKHSLTGDLSPFLSGSLLLPLYWICGITMSVGALRITNQAQKILRRIFKYSAVLQLVLIYFMYRFSWYHVAATDPLDKVMGPVFLLTVCSLVHSAYSLGGLFGLFAASLYLTMFTVAGYVGPLTVYGQQYVDCLDEHFPMQSVGFVAYVFGPITTVYSLCIFMVTVVTRINIEKYGYWRAVFTFGVPVFGIIAVTVLVQEVFIPTTSTQRLIIFCPRPEPSSTADYIESVFNLSTVAQSTLSWAGEVGPFRNISRFHR